MVSIVRSPGRQKHPCAHGLRWQEISVNRFSYSAVVPLVNRERTENEANRSIYCRNRHRAGGLRVIRQQGRAVSSPRGCHCRRSQPICQQDLDTAVTTQFAATAVIPPGAVLLSNSTVSTLCTMRTLQMKQILLNPNRTSAQFVAAAQGVEDACGVKLIRP